MHRKLRGLFILLIIAGLGLIACSSVGNSLVLNSTAGIYQTLQQHGLSENPKLRDDLYSVVLKLDTPWEVVRWLGISITAAAATGFVMARKSL